MTVDVAARAPGRFICLEGTDASGKTTLARRLADSLLERGLPVVFVDKKDTHFGDAALQERLRLLRTVLWDYPRDAPIAEWGDAHWFHLLVSWFSVLDRCRIQPLVQRGHWVVVDNWYFKFLARFMLKKDFQEAQLVQSFSHVSIPTDVFLLDVDPADTVGRRSTFSPTEAGKMDGLSGQSADDFVSYQRRVQEMLLRLAESRGWTRVEATGLGVEAVLERLLTSLDQRLLQAGRAEAVSGREAGPGLHVAQARS